MDLDQLGKIHRHHWKERLKINRIASFEMANMGQERMTNS